MQKCKQVIIRNQKNIKVFKQRKVTSDYQFICHIYFLFTFCLLFCLPFVYFLFTFCLLFVYFLFTFCLPFVYLLFTFCLLFVYFLFTFCLLFVYFCLLFVIALLIWMNCTRLNNTKLIKINEQQ